MHNRVDGGMDGERNYWRGKATSSGKRRAAEERKKVPVMVVLVVLVVMVVVVVVVVVMAVCGIRVTGAWVGGGQEARRRAKPKAETREQKTPWFIID